MLQTGAGLPLLFPKFEVGFGYSPCSGTAVGNEWRRQDTAVMDAPSIRVARDDLPIFVAICVGAVGNMTVVK